MNRRNAASMMLVSSLVWNQARSFCMKRTCNARQLIDCQQQARLFSTCLSAVSEKDEEFLQRAIAHAKIGFGHTFPNPAVGCVLVRSDTSEVIGSGFHPRAGSPHAEVFALLEAAGRLESGVAGAESVLKGKDDGTIQQLTTLYASEQGPEQLFGKVLESFPVTAYVTLEPCCHHGKTPPCASSLVLSKVNRVVVGFRDPNPRVDGGGVKLLQDAGIQVDMAEGQVNAACADLVAAFVKRITPQDMKGDYSLVNGAMRRAIRSIAGSKKNDYTLAHVTWSGAKASDTAESVESLELDPTWMETLDKLLWENEIVNLKLNKAVGKKKMAKLLGERIATTLDAHVAQTVGHTALLYRPGIPPVLDLAELVESRLDEEKS
jgi:pyrimidine deaminase RibD-like protein